MQCIQLLQAGDDLNRQMKHDEAAGVFHALAALEASSPASGPDGWTFAYPVNMEVYMTLLLAIFESAYFGGSPIAEAQDIIALIGRCRPALNFGEICSKILLLGDSRFTSKTG